MDQEQEREEDESALLLLGGILGGLWLLGQLRINFAPQVSGTASGTLAPSVTYNKTDAPSLPPQPPQPAPTAPDLWARPPSPVLNPWPRPVTPRGGFNAPRYVIKVGPLERSSGRPFFGGQEAHHMHQGSDFAAAAGEAVLAPEAGRAEIADPGPLGGPGAVAVRAGKRRWVFVHVKPSGSFPRDVLPGEMVAQVADGWNHLHVGLSLDGVNVDPAFVLGAKT